MFQIITLFLLLNTTVNATEHYRIEMPLRFIGNNQGNVGSCQSEAEMTALESVFAVKKIPVKLSTFYRHARNWIENPDVEMHKINLSEDDKTLLKNTGALIPYYMWPEDGEGYNPHVSGIRPGPSQVAIIDPAFPTAESLGFSKNSYVFYGNFKNTRPWTEIKTHIDQEKAVVLSLDARVLYSFDHRTGLIKEKSTFQFGKVNHAVAVVGYDDSLYSEPEYGFSQPGALIIRNSWNNESNAFPSMAKASDSAVLEAKLKQFRLKMFPLNLPGYYALPYAYMDQLVASGQGSFSILELDYQTYFNAYKRFSEKYELQIAPFACDASSPALPEERTTSMLKERIEIFHSTVALLASEKIFKNPRDVRLAKSGLISILLDSSKDATMTSASGSRFYIAKFSAHKDKPEIDRVKEFYNGKFTDYYCAKEVHDFAGAQIFPSNEIVKDEKIQTALGLLSENSSLLLGWYEFFNALP